MSKKEIGRLCTIGFDGEIIEGEPFEIEKYSAKKKKQKPKRNYNINWDTFTLPFKRGAPSWVDVIMHPRASYKKGVKLSR